MENKKRFAQRIIFTIILCTCILVIILFIAFKNTDKKVTTNTTNQNKTTDPRTEYIKEPTVTVTPETSMPVVDDIPTNE